MQVLLLSLILTLLAGAYILYEYRESLAKYEGRILAFAVAVTTLLYVTTSSDGGWFGIFGIPGGMVVSAFLLAFLFGTCFTIFIIETRRKKPSSAEP